MRYYVRHKKDQRGIFKKEEWAEALWQAVELQRNGLPASYSDLRTVDSDVFPHIKNVLISAIPLNKKQFFQDLLAQKGYYLQKNKQKP